MIKPVKLKETNALIEHLVADKGSNIDSANLAIRADIATSLAVIADVLLAQEQRLSGEDYYAGLH